MQTYKKAFSKILSVKLHLHQTEAFTMELFKHFVKDVLGMNHMGFKIGKKIAKHAYTRIHTLPTNLISATFLAD